MGGNSAVRLALKDYFTYEFTFCLFANFKNPSLSLSFLVDNGATVNLNGNQIFATTGGANFQLPARTVNYSGTSFWHAGPNTVQFVVRNDGGATGLDAVLHVKATGGKCHK